MFIELAYSAYSACGLYLDILSVPRFEQISPIFPQYLHGNSSFSSYFVKRVPRSKYRTFLMNINKIKYINEIKF